MDKSEDYKRGWQDAVGECARVAETYDPHIGNPGYERAITGSIAAAMRALAPREQNADLPIGNMTHEQVCDEFLPAGPAAAAPSLTGEEAGMVLDMMNHFDRQLLGEAPDWARESWTSLRSKVRELSK